jgi:hypothetical protein
MSGQTPRPEVLEALASIARGEGGARALAAALAGTDAMVLVLPEGEAVAYLRGLEQALGPNLENYGQVKSTDAPAPRPAGLPGPAGRPVPRAFTSHELANAWARANGLANAEGLVVTETKPWAHGLHESLVRDDGGMVVDEGTDHAITLARVDMARTLALLSLDAFAAMPTLYVLTANGSLHAQLTDDGSARQTYVFTSAADAEAGLARLTASGNAAVATGAIATAELLAKMTRAGVGVLMVNAGLPDARWYDAQDVQAMLRRLEASAPPAAPSPPRGPAPTPAILARARARPTPPLVAGPGRGDDARRAFWAALDEKIGERAIPTWLAVETLAYEMDVHVEVDPAVYEGLRWPSFYLQDGEPGRPSVTYLFAAGDALRDALAKRPAGERRGVSVAAVEALRWIAAAPAEVRFVALIPRAQQAGRRLPVEALLPALLPAAHQIGDLRQVPAVGLDRLGRLPGARALRPECVRALALGWRNLVGVKDERTVDVDGRPWRLVASSMEAFFASLPRGAGRVEPDPAGMEPPFARWLARTGACAGLVLDPAGGAPLRIEPTDLLVLDRWAAHPDRQPDAGEVLARAAELLAAGTITAEVAGRLAADFPVYWLAMREEDKRTQLLMFPATDALCLFTSEARARRYLDRLADVGPWGAGFTPSRVRFGWSANPFVVALDSFTEAWIDPDDPLAGRGLRLSNEAVRAAVARLDETLKPRVPGFLAAG